MLLAEEQQITENQRQKLKRLLTNDPLKFVVLPPSFVRWIPRMFP